MKNKHNLRVITIATEPVASPTRNYLAAFIKIPQSRLRSKF